MFEALFVKNDGITVAQSAIASFRKKSVTDKRALCALRGGQKGLHLHRGVTYSTHAVDSFYFIQNAICISLCEEGACFKCGYF
jgi:hypothetical protein